MIFRGLYRFTYVSHRTLT